MMTKSLSIFTALGIATAALVTAPAATAADPFTCTPTAVVPGITVTCTFNAPPAGNLALEDANTGQQLAYITTGIGEPQVLLTFTTPAAGYPMQVQITDQSTGTPHTGTVAITALPDPAAVTGQVFYPSGGGAAPTGINIHISPNRSPNLVAARCNPRDIH
jgi:hypothetical protein